MHHWFQPAKVGRFTLALLPWIAAITLGAGIFGLYQALWVAPIDYQQGTAVRIMYIHVPAAWMSLFIYTSMGLASISFLIWKNPVSDMVAQSSAPIGACFTFITLLTGSLWGKPIWGTWWVWDARLTSVLVLFFFYIAYLMLIRAFDQPTRAAHAAAILAVVGMVNVPIVKFSVDFWNTLHQPASILRLKGPSIHPSMLWPLLSMIIAAMGFYFTFLIIGLQTKLLEKKSARAFAKNTNKF